MCFFCQARASTDSCCCCSAARRGKKAKRNRVSGSTSTNQSRYVTLPCRTPRFGLASNVPQFGCEWQQRRGCDGQQCVLYTTLHYTATHLCARCVSTVQRAARDLPVPPCSIRRGLRAGKVFSTLSAGRRETKMGPSRPHQRLTFFAVCGPYGT